MLTLFSIPKPFRGHVAVIQRNAIRSWARLEPRCEILLLGNEEGVAEAASESGARHVPEIAVNEFGTPLVGAAFRAAEARGSHETLCYVNADIVLFNDLPAAVRRIALPSYLMAGQRFDLELPEPWDFGAPDWERRLREVVAGRGALHPPAGSDYFVFRREAFGAVPDFAIGRPGWDNWLIGRARALGIPVIDASGCVTVIHQNHGYAHVQGGSGLSYEGPEGERNLALAGGQGPPYCLNDATHLLTPSGLRKAREHRHLRRRIERDPCVTRAECAKHLVLEAFLNWRYIPGPLRRGVICRLT